MLEKLHNQTVMQQQLEMQDDDSDGKSDLGDDGDETFLLKQEW